MRILLLTDSLALPRDNPEEVRHEETWPELLKNEGHLVHQVSIGGATSSDLKKQVSYHRHFLPDIVILQVGIVDCSPRFASKFEIEVLKKIPVIGNKIIKIINKPSVRSLRKKTYVSKHNFGNELAQIKKKLNTHFIAIGIMPATEQYEKVLPGITDNILEYNSKMKHIFEEEYLDVTNLPLDALMLDFHHLNKKGHLLLNNLIAQKIKDIKRIDP